MMYLFGTVLFAFVSTSAVFDATKCTLKKGAEKCQKCVTSQQCKDAYDSNWYCCPYMKKCVSASNMPCTYPIANCRPTCFDQTFPINCPGCVNQDFPNNWIEGCTGKDESHPTAVPTNPPVTGVCSLGMHKGKKSGKSKTVGCAACVSACKKQSACVGAHFKGKKSGKGKKGKCQLFSVINNTTTKKKSFTMWKKQM